MKYAELAGCQPMRLDIFTPNTISSVSSYCLISNEEALTLSKDIKFLDDTVSDVFSGRISFSSNQNGKIYNGQQMADENFTSNKINSDTALQMSVIASATPNLINKLGPYTVISSNAAQILNFDYRLKPHLLDLIPDFFRGAIISDNNMNLIILTTEVYSRSASVDSHCEATEFSVPPSNLDISCGIYNKSDGGVEKAKLIIGTKTINLLVTVSVEISKDPVVHVGPGVEFSSDRISLDSFKIFVRTKEQDRLIKDFSSDDFLSNPMMLNLSHLRQLTTGFNKLSTYKPWRRSLNEFDTPLYIPATVFTLCSLPNDKGFGFGSSSLAAISSQVLQVFAVAVIINEGVLKKEELRRLLKEFSPVIAKKKNVKEWLPLKCLMQELEESLEKKGQLDVIEFSLDHNVAAVAKGLSSSVSTANTFIKKISKRSSLVCISRYSLFKLLSFF
ncbi:hypothetical protein G6F37_011077 [Rhizopus arrhizus]|nr:hypothetical protein G6F38_002358 [Rhizopus arrhizus]KAG1151023.1 hypothetical protein G6F37_011077 [Rhizopus arrhizus]